MAMASVPLRRITAMAPMPWAVEMATMVVLDIDWLTLLDLNRFSCKISLIIALKRHWFYCHLKFYWFVLVLATAKTTNGRPLRSQPFTNWSVFSAFVKTSLGN
jgi:hypothetical protein